jgi:hypothetical protein
MTQFLCALLIWESIVILPTAIVWLSAGRELRVDDLQMLLVIALVGVVVVAICAAIASRLGQAASGLLGFAVGVACPAAGGMVWSRSIGFEASAAVFVGSLLLSIPSGFAGAIVGWFLVKKNPH